MFLRSMWSRLGARRREARGGAFSAPPDRADVGGDVGRGESIASSSRCSADVINGVCADARKAWFRTPLHLRVQPARVQEFLECITTGSAAEIAAFMRDLAGQVLVRSEGEFWAGAGRMAEPVMESLLGPLVASRADVQGSLLDLESLKRSVLHWVECGQLLGHDESAGASCARQISDFAVASLGAGVVNPVQVRLGLIAPMVPVLETMIIMTELAEVSGSAGSGVFNG